MWNVTFYTYSGMPIPLATDVSADEAKEIVRDRLERAREVGQEYEKIGKGQWEFQDNGNFIGDADGILTVSRRFSRRIH